MAAVSTATEPSFTTTAEKAKPNLQLGTRDKNVGWYSRSDPNITDAQRDLLEVYSKLSPDQVIPHVIKIRDQLWDIYPFPCVGLFRFIDLGLSSVPSYSTIVERVKNGASLLDLGCCCGQDLRKLVRDGTPSDNLYGAELFGGLHDVGYDCFLDKDTFKGHMIQADIFDTEGPLKSIHGKIDIAYVGLFLHQFDWEGQVTAGQNIVKLMKDQPGALITGRQIGAYDAGIVSTGGKDGTVSFRHNLESFDKLWKEIGQKTGTEWKVESQYMDVRRDWTKDPKTTAIIFEVSRVA